MTTATSLPSSAALAPGDTVAGWLADLLRGVDPLAQLQQVRGRALAAADCHVFIHLCPAAAWQAQLATLAERLEHHPDRVAALRRYPLLGVPFAVKDNIDIAGEPTTAACPAFARVAARHAGVVQRLLDAGALWVGKTNLDQFATGLVGTRSPYGRPACVDDAQRISGGSSSGSAVAVALGIVPFALGTDTAGSGRIPAAFNGLVGLKPTPGRVSTAGVLPACRSLDCVSIFAHGVDNAAHVLAVIEGADAADAFSDFIPGPAQLPARLRLGVPRQPELDAAVGYPKAWSAAREQAQALGCELVEIDFEPLHEVAQLLYEGPWVAERHTVVHELLARQPEAIDPSVRQVISRALGLTATETFQAQYRLREMKSQLAALWTRVDALMVPSAPMHPTFVEVDADPLGVNAALGRYTNFVNLLGWCALALPAGRTATGLPFGVSFVAPGGSDAALLGLGRRYTAAAAALPLMRSPATAPTLALAVVGAHLSGLPLNSQLTERGAMLIKTTTTAPQYRLYALPGTQPPKPGLVHSPGGGGAAIALEVWSVPQAAIGSFLALVPPPLCLGSIELADGRQVHGFLCESHAITGARDITPFGGWRAYLATLAAPPTLS